MKQNVGSIDRIVRVILGLIFFALGLTGVVSGVWVWVVYILGAVMLATSAMSFCPIYMALNMSTRK